MRNFFQLVPRAIKVWAFVLLGLALTVGLGVAIWAGAAGSPWWTLVLYVFMACLAGVVLSTWLLGLGYVYADARRRAMRPALWVLLAIFVPHLLGFLLYFVLRQPIAAQCRRCAMQVPAGQRFCSWCGAPHSAEFAAGPAAGQVP